MIILTGGAGFIGSNLLKELNHHNISDVIIVDNLDHSAKKNNLKNLKFLDIVKIDDFFNWQKQNNNLDIEFIFHLGACSDTLELNTDFLHKNNVVYSQKLWNLACEKQIPFIYASSAATYGDGSFGFSDEHDLISKLKPLNAYGWSKQEFDIWVLNQKITPSQWAGLKYFNVYGPGEDHKGRMASVVWAFIQQLKSSDRLKLFEGSHGYDNGEQRRDFIYIHDAIKMTMFFFNNRNSSGIFNIATGTSHTFNLFAKELIKQIDKGQIEYVPFPKDLLYNYQAFTCAEMEKIKKEGYNKPVYSISDGIRSYLKRIR